MCRVASLFMLIAQKGVYKYQIDLIVGLPTFVFLLSCLRFYFFTVIVS
ncbi:unnamed protein product, partial [Larinioides sclopetarius]